MFNKPCSKVRHLSYVTENFLVRKLKALEKMNIFTYLRQK